MAQAYAIVVPVRPRRAAHHSSADMALAADRAGAPSSIRIEVGRLERGGELQRDPVGVFERQHRDAERRQVGDGAVLHATLLEGPGRGLQLSPAGHGEAQVVKAAGVERPGSLDVGDVSRKWWTGPRDSGTAMATPPG